jgi:hypothetical protein
MKKANAGIEYLRLRRRVSKFMIVISMIKDHLSTLNLADTEYSADIPAITLKNRSNHIPKSTNYIKLR